MPKPLEGVIVADFSQMQQGGWATMKLGDMGADVVKIEPPHGDPARNYEMSGDLYEGVSTAFLAMNRNKRSMVLDLTTDSGREVARDIVADADVLVENYRAGVMEQFDLGYEDVRAYNPDIVYVSGTGYGGSGPYADRPGQDLLAQAITALPTYTGRSDDPPTPAGTMVCDGHSAMNLALYTLMALFHRERTGEGQRVEVNLLSAGVDLQCAEITTELNLDADFERSEAGVGHIAAPGPYGIHATADGHVAVSFANLSNLADEFDLDPVCDYDDQPACYEYRDEIQRQVGAALADESTDLVMKRLLDVGVWVAEVNDYQDVIEDPQVEHNDMIVELDHPELGKFEVTGVPARLSATEPVMAPPPLLGEHTEEILQARDYEDGDIETLREDGAIPEAGD